MKLINDCGRGNSCVALRTRKLRSSSARVQHRPSPARRVTIYKCRSSETLEGRYPMLNSKTPLLACVLAALLGVGATLGVQKHESVRKVSAVKLPNVPGQTLTAEVVEYPPGGKSSVHHHAGSVFAYILTGRIRSQTSVTGPARVYKAGDTFFEPPGSAHLVSENASTTEPASLLAIIIAEDGAVLTKPGNPK
jgi:quercetin dioxygenase-like cupin family protein